MRTLLDLLRDLVLLRRGPQDVPFSPRLLGVLILVGLVVDLAVATRVAEASEVAPRVGFSMLLALALPWLALSIAGRRERFVQAATALIAVGIVFTLLAVPVVLGIGRIPKTTQELTGAQIALGWLSLVLVAWQLAARGHILRHALDLPLRLGVLIAVVFFALEVLLGIALFGRAA